MHPNNFIPQLYEDLPPATGGESSKMDTFSTNIDSTTSMTNLGSKLGILFPNPAPEVAPTVSESENVPTQLVQPSHKSTFLLLTFYNRAFSSEYSIILVVVAVSLYKIEISNAIVCLLVN